MYFALVMRPWEKCAPLDLVMLISVCKTNLKDLHRWCCYNLNRQMDICYYVDTLSIYLRVVISSLYPNEKFDSWLLE